MDDVNDVYLNVEVVSSKATLKKNMDVVCLSFSI